MLRRDQSRIEGHHTEHKKESELAHMPIVTPAEPEQNLDEFEPYMALFKEYEARNEAKIHDDLLEMVRGLRMEGAKGSTFRYFGYRSSVNSLINGPGIGLFSEDRVYVGEWFNGSFDGLGTLTQLGESYKGSFENNEFHGLGRLNYNQEEYKEGIWEKGQL